MTRDLPRHTARRPRAVAGAVLASLLVAAAGTSAALTVRQGPAEDPDPGPVVSATAPATPGAPTPTVLPSRTPTSATTTSVPPGAPTSSQAVPGASASSPASELSTDAGAAPTVTAGAPATLAPGVVATVRTVTPVREVPSSGGATGPGLVVRLAVRNDSGAPVDLDGLGVEATVAGAPEPPAADGVAAPMAGPLAGGDQASGTYVFRTAAPGAGAVLLRVGLAGSPAVAVTTG